MGWGCVWLSLTCKTVKYHLMGEAPGDGLLETDSTPRRGVLRRVQEPSSPHSRDLDLF